MQAGSKLLEYEHSQCPASRSKRELREEKTESTFGYSHHWKWKHMFRRSKYTYIYVYVSMRLCVFMREFSYGNVENTRKTIICSYASVLVVLSKTKTIQNIVSSSRET